jgi:hypothetical protein
MTFAIAGLTDRPAAEIDFPREGQRVNLIRHFEETYEMRVRFPRLPAVIKRTPQNESFFLMETLKIW